MADETSSFAALYARYAADVFRFAMFLCGDRDDAEDITSETFSRAWTSSAPIRTDSVKAYLMTIARHVYLRERRRQARRAPLPDDIADARLPADESLEQRDHVHAVRAQLSALKELDRSAILMHATMDMTYQQIADALGISLASVKIKIFRARLALAHAR